MKRNNVFNLMESMGFVVLFLFFYVELLTTTLLCFSVQISKWILPVGLLLSFLTMCYVKKDSMKIKEMVWCCVLSCAILIIFTLTEGCVYGREWDGNEYHKMAIGLLKNGWNPVRESAAIFAKQYFHSDVVNSYAIWIDHYAKGSWMFSAVVYLITGNLECGKVYQLLGIFSLIMFAISFFGSKYLKNVQALLLALIIALNPVSISQIFSFYVDGLLFCYLFILILGLLKLSEANNIVEKREAWFIIWGSMPVLANIKFTGLLYGGIYCIVFYFLNSFFEYIKEKKLSLKYMFSNGVCYFCLALFSIIWMGYPTYVKNFLDHGTCTYPLTGTDINILRDNAPRGFDGKGNLYKVFYSIFGEYSNFFWNSEKELPELKIPFSIQKAELVIPDLDARISGFGLFFSGILIIAISICCIWLLKIKNADKMKAYVLVLLVTSGLMIVFISGSWWARFAPHIYITVLTSTFICMQNKLKWKKCWYTIYLVLILINSVYFALQPIKAISGSRRICHELDELSGKTVEVSMDNFWGRLFALDDYNIEYTVVNDIKQPDGECYLIFQEPVKWKELRE